MEFGARISLHTHTRRCKHALGLPADYCAEAIRQGIAVLGFSDHAPFPDNCYRSSRMDFDELDAYCAEVDAAREAFPELTVLKGFEVDYFPRFGKAFYEDLFLGRCGADYLIAGTHFLEPFDPALNQWDDRNRFGPREVRRHLESHLAAMETGLFDCMAHPDTFGRCCPAWTPEVGAVCADWLAAAVALDIPLEMNAYGLRKEPVLFADGPRAQYPWRAFWELAAEHGARVVAGADAHRPCDVWGNTDEILRLAAGCGLTIRNAELAEALVRRRGSDA